MIGCSTTFTNPTTGDNIPLCDPRYRSQTQVLPGFHNPYTQQWTFSVQRQLSSKIAAEVRYVGNHTIGQFQTVNANPAVGIIQALGFDGNTPGLANVIPKGVTACPTGTLDPFYPGQNVPAPGATVSGVFGIPIGYQDCNHVNVGTRSNTAFSLYHGLQTQLDFQNWHGFTANFAYTYSKSIDNASEIFSTFAGGQGIVGAQNPFNSNQGERAVKAVGPYKVSQAFVADVLALKQRM